MLENLTKSMFAENVHSMFNVRHGAGQPQPLALELVELREGTPQSDYERFSLFFRGPRSVLLPQSSYELEHPNLGTFLLFLVPIRQDENGTYYESVFYRSTRQKAEQ